MKLVAEVWRWSVRLSKTNSPPPQLNGGGNKSGGLLWRWRSFSGQPPKRTVMWTWVCGFMLFTLGVISLFTGHVVSHLEWYSQQLSKRSLLDMSRREPIDVWKSKYSKFFYGCSERGRNFPPAVQEHSSNGYLLIAASGGLNQQRTGITDAVVVARILNATLVVPELDHHSYWKDNSDFNDIFDVNWFISSLTKDVTIVKRVPDRVMRSMEKPPYTMRVPRKSTPEYYLDQVLPILSRRHVLQLTKFDYRLANDLEEDMQKLRCRVNYNALRFTKRIQSVGMKVVKRMRKMAKRFIAVHLRFEPDMLAFSGCDFGGGETERAELAEIRKRWDTLPDLDPMEERKRGKCPLTPHEVGLMLRALGFANNTYIYVASGEIYGGEKTLRPLRDLFPNFYTKEMLANDELKPLLPFSSRLAAIDYIVSDESDVFITNNNGNMAKILAGRRRYMGHKRTIRPNAKKLSALFMDREKMEWNTFAKKVKSCQRGFMGDPDEFKPGRGEFHEYPQSCICQRPFSYDKHSTEEDDEEIPEEVHNNTRPGHAFSWLVLFLSLLSLLPLPSESAVASVDLGSEWVKVAVVNIKRGQSPISVAINEMSKRKSPSLVAFHSGDRLLGEEAAGITARYPNKVYSQIRDMVGKPFKHVKDFIDSVYLPFDIVEDSRGAVGVKIDDGTTVYSVEELLAMILGYGSDLAEFHAKIPVKDMVVSIPPYFGQAERRGLIQASQLAGVNVLSLVHEHSGAALQYGIDKDFSNGSRHVIFYDMGSSSTYAALVYYSAYNEKEFGKTVSVNQFQVKDVRWDSGLGGQSMEMRLVEYFADEFNKQLGNGVDVRKFPKAMAKLKKQVKRTKEILSANTGAPISVESLHDDRDFRSTISREKFEELCKDLWERSLTPLKDVLKHSGLKMDDIYAVELIGGATRVPKLQSTIQEFIGKQELDKHLDADEAIVLGSALHAANLSDGIKLKRRLGIVDGSPYGFLVELEGPDVKKDESTKQQLVPRMKKLPSKMFRTFVLDKDFDVSLAYESEDILPPGITSPVFAQYSVSGLTDATEKYSSRNLSAPIKANLHFSLSRSGILSLDRGDAVIEITEWVEVPKKNVTIENNTTSTTGNASTGAASDENSQENKEELQADAGNSTAEEPAVVDLGTEKKLKKRTFRIPLKVVEKTVGPGAPFTKESLAEAKTKLEALDKKDRERRRTAELKNNLESYIYATKEKLETPEFEKISTQEERKAFVEKLDEVQDWLYMDGEDANATEFQERLDSLKAIGSPISLRSDELTARPVAVEYAQKYLTEVKEIIKEWETNKTWLPKEKINEVSKEAEKVKSWLEKNEAEQKKTALWSKPAFTSDEVYAKVFTLQDKVTKVNRIPKPKPKIEKATKKENATEEKSKGSEDSTNSSESEAAAKEEEGHDEL
ncbi:heat shock 70 kDa protein 17 isoform X2 [Raphanus sativus]|uniref:O-fucosyltransferase family protein n=1 Tax=Raphanus sativus TaxID=3726 RepID=A0A9W3DLD0_RAPSA|nr:heat shock 70 kDa protein 17 isoform X2 [Raphanus sativus]